ncbi:MAG TPA: GNAT family N-acetyltransferase [Rhizomicrobium sp.]|nr:GNAT family N-acetyltransferase [Rhizomicrobium sp.]
MADVVDAPARGRFELTENGLTAFATYRRAGNRVTIPHVEAPVPLRGKGTASRLMQGIVALARADGSKIVPSCPYAAAWFRRYPQNADVLDRS